MILVRYFSRQLLRAHIEVSVLFAAGLFLARLISEFRQVKLGYSSAAAIQYAVIMVPTTLAQYDSLIVVLATTMWFLHVRKTHELLMARIAGLSAARLLLQLIPAFLMVIICMTMNREWIAPQLASYAKEVRAMHLSKGTVLFRNNVIWMKVKDGFLQAHVTDSFDKLTQIKLFQISEGELTTWITAKEARYKRGQWRALFATQHSFVDEAQEKIRHVQMLLPISLKPDVIAFSSLKPDLLSINQMLRSLKKTEQYGLSYKISWLLLGVRIFRPLNLLLLMVLTVVLLEKTIATRATSVGYRACTVIGIGVCEFFLFEVMSVYKSTLNFWLGILTAAVPSIVMVGILVVIYAWRVYIARLCGAGGQLYRV